jgi:hypothetical protein
MDLAVSSLVLTRLTEISTWSHGDSTSHNLGQEGVLERVPVHHEACLQEDANGREVLTQKFLCIGRAKHGQLALHGRQGLDGRRPDLLPLGVDVVGYNTVVVDSTGRINEKMIRKFKI